MESKSDFAQPKASGKCDDEFKNPVLCSDKMNIKSGSDYFTESPLKRDAETSILDTPSRLESPSRLENPSRLDSHPRERNITVKFGAKVDSELTNDDLKEESDQLHVNCEMDSPSTEKNGVNYILCSPYTVDVSFCDDEEEHFDGAEIPDNNYPCSSSNESYDLLSEQEDAKNHVSNAFSCSVCDKSFRQNCNLVRHMLTHSGERPFSCSICGRGFSQKGALTRHSCIHSGVHSSKNMYACPICDKLFTQKAALNRHTLTHSGEKQFYCHICDKRYSLKFNFKIHMLTHGEKPFPCSICDKRFTRRDRLKRHLAVHSKYKTNSEKPTA